MFASRYFSRQYWADRYFANAGAAPSQEPLVGQLKAEIAGLKARIDLMKADGNYVLTRLSGLKGYPGWLITALRTLVAR